VAQPRLGEFARIARYFAPLAGPGALGLLDDAALIDPLPGRQFVLTADAIVEGVHFLPGDPPDLVARKLMRVNLSDLAAKGATPLYYLMTTALPERCGEEWLAGFSAGLAADQAEFGIALLGGDSVATSGPIALSLMAIGSVPEGAAIRRGGALAGDVVFVSGSIGDAALGLSMLTGGLAPADAEGGAYLADRYRLPRPRVALGGRLLGLAHAMIDVSDGLVADLGHVCEVSGLAAIIEAERVPLSAPAARVLAAEPARLPQILAGGDDYELLFTAAPDNATAVAAVAAALALPITAIGRIETGAGVRVLDAAGREISLAVQGFQHF
jgi:thiamine-monophosphate kinase